ncbi:LacI family transcriptional regulator [Salinibacterium amurskyense]|uniref:LacI family transcriptional regulator n=1 Tax=Salinibacterium amurskyense TaxID=205941 RepID=A0A2M9D829_9MICO|nr:LacI family DNA-binding transcriptional regulator [Salinibacterium amurskyense]PJJ81875.1 LacI family transcriptional regulator [Salinibacterium amurskyense]RLQ81673.1 LacI family transcriptional regulator [Salinibacterium amurskyense]GHD78989.1 LacI family transcriptional regulator [Salinibacterium amurskyense]
MNEPTARRRDVTVADVAREAKVAKATAARSLGGYGAVSDDVRQRVQAAAEALGYHANGLARSMNTGRSNTIGVIVGDIENPYFGLAMRGITDTAKAAGYDVILANTGEQLDAEIDAARVFVEKRVDGFIVAPASFTLTDHLSDIMHSGRPLVLLDRHVANLDDVDVIEVDNEKVAHAAAQHLIDRGHERIAFITTLELGSNPYQAGDELGVSSVSARVNGILAAMNTAGVDNSERYLRFGANSGSGVKGVTRELMQLEEPPTAIIASDSLIAMGVLGELRELGLTVPDDVSFIMFDDFEWATLISPALTVIAQPVYEVGVAAATRLIARIEGRVTGEPIQVFPAALVHRKSVAPPRVVGRDDA